MKFERNTCITQQLTWNMCSVTVKISVHVCSKTVHPMVNGNQRICVQLASFSMLQLDNTRAMDKYCQCFHSPCFSHAFPMLCYMYGRRTHTHTHTIVQIVLLSILFCTIQSKLSLWYFAGSYSSTRTCCILLQLWQEPLYQQCMYTFAV